MKFLIDAQLPRWIAYQILAAGHDALHTLDLPDGNRTTDNEIRSLAAREGRIVVTKDTGFVDTFILSRQPEKLLLVATGNISNKELGSLLDLHLNEILEAFSSCDFVELTRTALVLHSNT